MDPAHVAEGIGLGQHECARIEPALKGALVAQVAAASEIVGTLPTAETGDTLAAASPDPVAAAKTKSVSA